MAINCPDAHFCYCVCNRCFTTRSDQNTPHCYVHRSADGCHYSCRLPPGKTAPPSTGKKKR